MRPDWLSIGFNKVGTFKTMDIEVSTSVHPFPILFNFELLGLSNRRAHYQQSLCPRTGRHHKVSSSFLTYQ